MRYLVLSDIHANHIALEAVLKHAQHKRWDAVLFLGDAIGYYTHPNKVLDSLRDLKPEVNLLGNHEDLLFRLQNDPKATAFEESSVVTDVIRRHAAKLSPENRAYLNTFTQHEVRDGWEATHGGLRTPWEYITSLQNAQENAPLMKADLLFVGHTHVPKVFASVATPNGDMWRTVAFRSDYTQYRVPPKAKVIFNPGSVGQPRDGISLASYVIFDEEHRVLEVFRVEFDLLGVQRNVREMGYPDALASRLRVGK